MAFVNLPPNLQDIFYGITDRIAKLETGPNQALYVAEGAAGSSAQAITIAISAQSVATNAQVQAINAGIQANNAAAQATIAQSQATIASTQATTAQASASGKSRVWYSTSTPGATANNAGDIWYQYGTSGTYANKVIAQWSGAGGTSWTSVTVSGLVIANIDAGSITTGTLSAITITAGSGANSFNVSSSGVMSAQGAYIKGNITADSGTFNGSIYSAQGLFGSGSNYWSIGASGLTGVGSAVITGGLIQGSSITVPNSSAWKFAVDSSGSLQAVNANITGAISATSGYIGSASTGWQFTSSGYLYSADTTLYPTTSPGGNANTFSIYTQRGVYADTLFITSATNAAVYSSGGLYALGALNTAAGSTGTPLFRVNTSGAITNVAGITSQDAISSTGTVSGASLSSSGSITSSGAVTFVSGSSTQFQVLSTGLVRSLFTYNRQVSSARTLLINSSGDFGNSTSTRRHKHQIESYKMNTSNLLQLNVKQYKYLESIDPEQKIQHGFIAEEAQDLGLDELIQYDSEGIPDYFAYEKLPIFLLQLAQEQDARLKALEGK